MLNNADARRSLVALLLIETLVLYVLHVRLDLGRPILIFAGVSILSIWLVVDEKKEVKDAFKKGSDFLAAGRLEPARTGSRPRPAPGKQVRTPPPHG